MCRFFGKSSPYPKDVPFRFDSTGLAPGMTSNRTWKGTTVGVLDVVFFGVALMPLPGSGQPTTAAVISATLGMAVQLGDFFHERLKLRAGVDDSARTFSGMDGSPQVDRGRPVSLCGWTQRLDGKSRVASKMPRAS